MKNKTLSDEICKCGHEKKHHTWKNGKENAGSCSHNWIEYISTDKKIIYCKCNEFKKNEK